MSVLFVKMELIYLVVLILDAAKCVYGVYI